MKTKCKSCKKITEHKESGYKGYNLKETCLECGFQIRYEGV